MKRKGSSRKRTKVKDLAPASRRARVIKGGAIDIRKTPSPSGPIPLPYPN